MAFNIKFQKKVVINGKEYGSIDEVPPEFRHAIVGAVLKVGGDAADIHRTTSEKITVNGVEYGSIEDVPAEFRDAIKKTMAKGGKDAAGIHRTIREKIIVNGVEYESVEAMPANVRQLYERAMEASGPTLRERVSSTASSGAGATLHRSRSVVSPVRKASDEPASGARILIMLLALAAAAVLIYLFTRGGSA